MRGFGIAVLIVGVLWVLIAMNMDVSIATGMGERVNNLGLIAQRSNQTMIGGLVAIAGLLMLIFGGRQATVEIIAQEEDERPCPFCAEPIKHAAIKCKHCGSDVATQELIAAPGLRFGWVARVICTDQETRDRVTDKIVAAGFPVIEMLKVGGVAAGAFEKKVEAEKAADILSKDLGFATTVMFRDKVSGDYS